MLIAVLDANVLYPMMLRDTMLRAAAAGCFRAHWSSEILDEVERNLIKNGRMIAEKAKRLRFAMETAFPDAMVEDYQALSATMGNHPKDRHIAAAGVAIGATIIVTLNIRDFRPLPPGLTAMTPDDFLQSLWNENAPQLRTALERQAAAFRRPEMTPDAIIDHIAMVAPGFVRLWRGERD